MFFLGVGRPDKIGIMTVAFITVKVLDMARWCTLKKGISYKLGDRYGVPDSLLV